MADDHDLRERFAGLRREDETRAGDLRSFMRAARPIAKRSGIRAWFVGATCLAVIVALFAISAHYLRRHGPIGPQTSITEWKSPTDFLLQTPGIEVLRTVPQIGEWPGSMGNRAQPRESRAGKKTGKRR